MTHHVILGAGPAGVIAAETIRKHAPNDRITLVGDEAEPPYSRMAIPYLLIGNIDERGTYLRKNAQHFQQLGVEQVHARAHQVDVNARSVQLSNGSSLNFDKLLIATGSTPFIPPVPGKELDGVFTYRTLEDLELIREQAKHSKRGIVVGGAFQGVPLPVAVMADFARAEMCMAFDAAGGINAQNGVIAGQGLEVVMTLGTGLGCAIFDGSRLAPVSTSETWQAHFTARGRPRRCRECECRDSAGQQPK